MEDTISTTLTTAQIDDLIRRETTRIANAERDLNDALTGVANIERGPDSDAVKAHRLSELEPVVAERERDAIAAASLAEANLREVLTLTGGNQPMLTDAEIATANARREFIKEDVSDRDLPGLLDMTRHALTTDDRPTLYLLTRYLPNRLQASEASWADTGAADGAETLRKLIREASDRLRDGRLDPLQKRAQDALSKALKLDRDARKRTPRTYGFQSAREVSW